MKQSQSANFFNKNKGKEDFDDEVTKSTKAPIKSKVRGRQRGRSKFRNDNNANSVTSAPTRNADVFTQKAFTELNRQTFTNAPIVVQPVTSRLNYDTFRSNNSTTLQSNNYRSTSSPSTNPPAKRDENFFDVPKTNQKSQTTQLKSAPVQSLNFVPPSTTAKPTHNTDDSYAQNLFGAIPQRVIVPSKLSPEQRKALQASNSVALHSTTAGFTAPTTTENPQFVPQFNRIAQNFNQHRQNNEQKSHQDFSSHPQKFNFKTQKYEPVEPLNPTTQFYNAKYETKGTEQPLLNLEPTRSGLSRQTNKTFATRQLAGISQDESKPTTFNPQQYYQSEQSQYQNLSPRGFSLAAQRQQDQPVKTTQPEPHPQITSRSEARSHKKFSTLVPKDQYSPTTFKPHNGFSKKPVDTIASQKSSDKVQNPNKYYAQFTSTQATPAPTTSVYTTAPPHFSSPQAHFNSPQPQFNTPQPQFYTPQPQFNNHHQNNFQQHTTRNSNFFSSTPSVRPLAEGEEDDGQYRPELYEKDFFRNKAKTTKITQPPIRNTFSNNYYQSTTSKPQNQGQSGEDELLKTAHSQNIFASGNQLRNEKEREKTVVKYNDFTEKSSPRPFSKPTPVTSTTAKPVKQSKKKEEKDVSYDYQYYDTNADQHDYSELETIEDFGKTAKKSSRN